MCIGKIKSLYAGFVYIIVFADINYRSKFFLELFCNDEKLVHSTFLTEKCLRHVKKSNDYSETSKLYCVT